MQFLSSSHLRNIKQEAMENKISIPKPCHEDWNAMLPEEQGRFCLSCSKTVVDFSTWEPDDILGYLRNGKEGSVCGRFNTTQVAGPLPPREHLLDQVIRSAHIPFLRKIAAVIVLCFGLLSAGEAEAQHTKGKIRVPRVEHTPANAVPAKDTAVVLDTAKFEPQIMGMIAMPPKEIKKEPRGTKSTGTKKKMAK